jgi:hypothetical protein
MPTDDEKPPLLAVATATARGLHGRARGRGQRRMRRKKPNGGKGKYRLAGKWAAIQSMRADGRKPRRQLLDGTAKLMTRPCQLK